MQLRHINPVDVELSYDEESLVTSAFTSFVADIDSEDTNKIFVYCGSYSNSGSDMIKEKASSEFAEYRKYIDIEQRDSFFVPVEECDEFEKDKTIIVGSLDHIRKTFIETCLKEGQEKAVSLIKSKYKTNYKQRQN